MERTGLGGGEGGGMCYNRRRTLRVRESALIYTEDLGRFSRGERGCWGTLGRDTLSLSLWPSLAQLLQAPCLALPTGGCAAHALIQTGVFISVPEQRVLSVRVCKSPRTGSCELEWDGAVFLSM